MLRINRDKGYNIVLRFVVSYILVMVIVLSLGSITFYSARNMARSHAVSGTISGLEKTRDTINARFVEINNMMTQIIMFDKNVTYFANKNKPLSNADYCKMIELRAELNKYILSNSFMDEVYLYFEYHGIMISPHFIYENVPMAYGRLFEYEGMDYEQWKSSALPDSNQIITAPRATFIQNGQHKSVIPVINSISARSIGGRGAITVLVGEDKILEYLRYIKGIDASSDGVDYFITDSDGNVLISDKSIHDLPAAIDLAGRDAGQGSFAISLNQTQYTVAYITCPETGWVYAASIPPDYFADAIGYISKTYLLVTACAFVLGLLIAVWLAFQTSKPIRSTLEILHTSAGSYRGVRSDDDYIKGTLLDIIKQNTVISQRLNDQKPILREAIVKKLLLGGFSGSEDISAALSYIDLDIQADSFIVGLMQIAGYGAGLSDTIYDQLNMSKLVAEDIICKNRAQPCYFCNTDDDKMAVIFQIGHADQDATAPELENCLGNVVDELAKLGINVAFSVGDLCTGTENICQSYQQAEKASALATAGDNVKVRWFCNIDDCHTGYYYPMDIEIQLINLVKMGETEKVQTLLSRIYEENFIKSGLQHEDVKQLTYEMRGTLSKLWTEVVKEREEARCAYSFHNTVGALDLTAPVDELYSSFTGVFLLFCEVVNEKKRSHNLSLKNRILEYINLNYYNPSLCLYDVASQFGLSDKYLSDFFKEQTGENFSTYVESLRMDRILEMLKEDTLSISSIASQSGYYSANTLYKVFKRKFGISPGTYRQHYALNKGQ